MFNYLLTKILKIAGYVLETREEAIIFAGEMRMKTPTPSIIFNHVGEHAKDSKQAYQSFSHYNALLQHIDRLNGHISVKPSQFGKHRYLIDLLAFAMSEKKRMLWIDAEEYNKSPDQLAIAIRLTEKLGEGSFCPIGLTIQLRADNCVRYAMECFENGIRVRLCKGAYPKKQKRSELLNLAQIIIEGHKCYMKKTEENLLEIATIKDMDLAVLATEHRLPLQVLYGWHEEFLDHLYGATIYVPFGNRWWPYIKRRIRGK